MKAKMKKEFSGACVSDFENTTQENNMIKKVQPKLAAPGAERGRPDGGGKPCIPAGLPGEKK